MKMNRGRWAASVLTFAAGFAASWIVLPRAGGAEDTPTRVIRSRVIPLEETPRNKGDWGEMRPYFIGETPGTESVFAAAATVLPGKAIHRAHRHVEEEYLLITRGSGTWHLDGREFPANEGDLLYAEPWVYHGIQNTGEEPLTFLVIKFNPKNRKLPERPDDRPDVLDR